MRIFGMLLIVVGAAIIVFFGILTVGLGAADPAKEFIVALAFGGPIAALGLILVAIRKPEKKMPAGGA